MCFVSVWFIWLGSIDTQAWCRFTALFCMLTRLFVNAVPAIKILTHSNLQSERCCEERREGVWGIPMSLSRVMKTRSEKAFIKICICKIVKSLFFLNFHSFWGLLLFYKHFFKLIQPQIIFCWYQKKSRWIINAVSCKLRKLWWWIMFLLNPCDLYWVKKLPRKQHHKQHRTLIVVNLYKMEFYCCCIFEKETSLFLSNCIPWTTGPRFIC